MRAFSKRLPIFLVLGVFVLLAFKGAYSFAARNGMLGDDAYRKYVKQTAVGTSTWNLLMAGRKEFFIGMRAAIDKPIIGYGPKAEDTEGYYENFLRDYGSYEDYEDYIRYQAATQSRGYTYRVIPTHSHIACAWVEDGIFGLVFWLYVLWLIYKCFRSYASAIPQWFGYFCCVVPSLVWDIFFSPFGSRVGTTLAITCILFAKSVYERRMILPIEMEMEARRHD